MRLVRPPGSQGKTPGDVTLVQRRVRVYQVLTVASRLHAGKGPEREDEGAPKPLLKIVVLYVPSVMTEPLWVIPSRGLEG